jgi:hydrogenase-4 component E
MNSWFESLLVLLTLTNLILLGSSRLGSLVKMLAAQGFIIGGLALGINKDHLTLRIIALAGGGAIIKSVILPLLLMRGIAMSHIRLDSRPRIGYSLSLFIGAVTFGFSVWLAARLPIPGKPFSSLVVPVSFFMMFTGLFLIVSRPKAITQVISYLVLENGIYLFGIAFVREAPLIVELGVLLDVMAAIMVMGIIVHHIGQEFDTLNVSRLSELKDWEE